MSVCNAHKLSSIIVCISCTCRNKSSICPCSNTCTCTCTCTCTYNAPREITWARTSYSTCVWASGRELVVSHQSLHAQTTLGKPPTPQNVLYVDYTYPYTYMRCTCICTCVMSTHVCVYVLPLQTVCVRTTAFSVSCSKSQLIKISTAKGYK